MAKKMLIDATHPEETRVVVADGNKVDEFDFETINKRQLVGNIYLAKVTRVEPSLQAAFVDYGGNRHGFLAFSEIHPDYYQIPKADRDALLAEEIAEAEASKPEEHTQSGEGDVSNKSDHRGDEDVNLEVQNKKEAGTENDVSADTANGAKAHNVPADTGLGDSTITQDPETSIDVSSGLEIGASDEQLSKNLTKPDTILGMDIVEIVEDSHESIEFSEENAQSKNIDEPAEDLIDEVSADDLDQDEIRPVRRLRTRRYKIQEVIKVRQIMLIQVVKEERGNKGAALTTYLSLAGRYCVLMPNTARGGGISRKITHASDRKKLKEIAADIDVPKDVGLIIRTAGAKRSKTEIKRDYEYLQRQWEQIRDLTLKSIAPAPIYEEGDLIRRSIRDLYTREIDEVLVEGETGYRQAKDFMKMIMPSHAKNVKPYTERMPLFTRYQVESYLSDMFNPRVQLRSGGYIVIDVTEALVAIDVNSGKATKQGSIEETALKTNLEAAVEVARQLRLRDLAGLIIIDFIDMDERRNNTAVEKRIKEALQTDRARIQVGRISGFGLMEMSRQRLRPGMIEATTQSCPACHGTGLVRSGDSIALQILRTLEEEGTRGQTDEIVLKVPVQVANFIINQKRAHLTQIEERYKIAVSIVADPHLVVPDYEMEKIKNTSRISSKQSPSIVSVDSSFIDDTREQNTDLEEEVAEGTEEEKTKPRRRRRSRRRGKATTELVENSDTNNTDKKDTANSTDEEIQIAADKNPAEKSSSTRPKRRRNKKPQHIDDKTETEVSKSAQLNAASDSDAPDVQSKNMENVSQGLTVTQSKSKPRQRAKAPATEDISDIALSQIESPPQTHQQDISSNDTRTKVSNEEPKAKRLGWWRR